MVAAAHWPHKARFGLHDLTFGPQTIAGALAAVIPEGSALHEPEIKGNEKAYVNECLESGWVSSAGAFVNRFEKSLTAYTGAKHAIACVNGTAALHVCLLLAGVKPGDEVITPTLTFVATANAAAYCFATPHFADCDERSLGLDPAKLASHLESIAHVTKGNCYNRRTGKRIACAVCMHAFGHAADMDPLIEVCRHYKLPLVEDAAESLGSLYKGRHTGVYGLLGALSFNGNKIVTCGGGGAILTNDDRLAALAKHLTTTAKKPHPFAFDHDMTGFNYRMPNINAALGLAQMERLDEFVARKRSLAKRYQDAFKGIEGVDFFHEPPGRRSNYWLNALLLSPENKGLLDEALKAANGAGYMVRPAWTPMHFLPMYKDCPRMNLDTAEDIHKRLINIPSSASLAPREQNRP